MEQESILSELKFVSFRIKSELSTFQGKQDMNCGITVENTTDKSGNAWAFFTNVSRERIEYGGRDLEELKKRFSTLLRIVMQELQRRPT